MAITREQRLFGATLPLAKEMYEKRRRSRDANDLPLRDFSKQRGPIPVSQVTGKGSEVGKNEGGSPPTESPDRQQMVREKISPHLSKPKTVALSRRLAKVKGN